MLGQQFYNETMRKVVVAFGTMFNNINLVRMNSAGEVTQTMKVPLAYVSKNKWLARLREDPNQTKKVAVTLPRLGFEINNISYDPSRKLNSVQKFKKVNNSTDGKTMSQQYMPVPYNMDFELFVMAKNSDDALQIVEQILPFFQPDYTVTLNDNSAMGTTRDVPIVLTNVGYEDSYEGDMVTRRSIIYTLSFTAKILSVRCLLLTRRLLRQYKLTSTQIYLSMHLRENRDILLHQVRLLLMQMMILVSMRQPRSSKTQRITMKRQVRTQMTHKYYKRKR